MKQATHGWRSLTVAGVLFCALSRLAAADVLIATNSVWKYLDDGADLGSAWTAPAFNDSDWYSGPAKLGYGDTDIRTVVNGSRTDGSSIITTYFRRTFNVTRAPAYTNLALRVQRDDGVVVYLNGSEVWRSNMPQGPITFNALASAAVGGTDETTFFGTNLSSVGLVEGVNVVAVELHQSSATSSDLGFDLELQGSTRFTLVPTNAVYRLFGGVSEASDPTGAWRELGFDDSAWSVKPGPFFYDVDKTPEPYYGNTELPDMINQYLSIYLRHAFVVESPLGLTNLVIRTKCDDGVIVCINGQEVFRSATVAAGEIPHTYAAGTVQKATEPLSFVTQTIAAPASVLVAGTNVLAVRGLNSSLTSDDLLADVAIYAEGRDPAVAPPVVAAVSPAPGTVFEVSPFTVRFSKPVAGVDAADLLVNGVAATNVAGGGDTWTFAFPRPASGPVSVAWAADHGIADLCDPPQGFNATAPGAVFGYVLLSAGAPRIVAQQPPAGATVHALSSVAVFFNEAVTNVEASDLLVNGVPATGLSGGGSNYVFSFAQPPFGPVSVTWAEGHGIADCTVPANPFETVAPGSTWQYLLQGAQLTLVPTSAVYRLLKGEAEASDPVDAWRQPDFDDSAWSPTPAPFFYDIDQTPQPYYGNTELVDMIDRYLSIYLRHRFVVEDPGVLTNLVIRTKCDDGVVLWINGQEVFRSASVPSGEIPWDYASGTVVSVDEPPQYVTQTIAVPAAVLVPGTNVLAARGLNSSLASSDLLVNLEVYATAEDPLRLPPVVADVSPRPGPLFDLTSIAVHFSKPVTNVSAADLLVNGVAATDVAGNGAEWTFVFPRPDLGPVSVTWAADHGITDTTTSAHAFEGSAPGAVFGYTLFSIADPHVAGQSPPAGATVTNLTAIAIEFSQSVTNVDAADLLVNGVPATGITGSGSNYVFSFLQPPYGVVSLAWDASHGIADPGGRAFQALGPGAEWTYTLADVFPPVVVAQDPPAGAFVANLTQITVTFDEPVANVDAGDLLVNGHPARTVAGGGAVYTFTFPRPNAADIAVGWAGGHGIADRAAGPNPFDARGPGASWSYSALDDMPPVIVQRSPSDGAWVRSLTNVTVWFDEPVAGVDAADLLIGGRPARSVTGAGAGPYRFKIDPPGKGWARIEWTPETGIRDLAASPNPFAGGSWTCRIVDLIFGHVVHISVDGLGAYYLRDYVRVAPSQFPNFVRLASEGASSMNARGDATSLVTMPNHASMLTGRPVRQPSGWPNTAHHGVTFDSDNGGTMHNSGNTNVPYKASVFDVVHDHAFSTAFLHTKAKFAFYVRSWNPYGAPDTTGEDNGTAKIDYVLSKPGASVAVTDEIVAQIQAGRLRTYTFVHFADPDLVGHASGWGSAAYSNTVRMIDAQVGRILDALLAAPALASQTALILSADHGGHSTTHGTVTNPRDYILPFYIWGAGVPAGVDAYTMFANRGDPGSAATDYTTPAQPLRNGDTGNLALSLLGLPPVPGSSMVAGLTAQTDPVTPPDVTFTASGGGSVLIRFDGIPDRTYRIEYCDDLGPGAWQTLGGTTADDSGLVDYLDTPPAEVPQRFYRAVYP